MKFVNFRKDHRLVVGVVSDDGVVDIAAAADSLGRAWSPTYADILAGGEKVLSDIASLLREAPLDAACVLDESSLVLGPAALDPQKIICVGLNYREHIKEMKLESPSEPILFGKFANSLAASGQDIDISGLVEVDYEAELAVVIGKKGRNVSEERALDLVLGYANTNDLSVRDLQFRSGQWLIGKSLDDFLPIGPYLVTADEIPDPNSLIIRGWMNGELRQDGNTGDMVFSVAEIISYASRFMTLLPGDIIATGTPPGVINGTKEKVWMKPGDSYEVEVAGFGRLKNRLSS